MKKELYYDTEVLILPTPDIKGALPSFPVIPYERYSEYDRCFTVIVQHGSYYDFLGRDVAISYFNKKIKIVHLISVEPVDTERIVVCISYNVPDYIINHTRKLLFDTISRLSSYYDYDIDNLNLIEIMDRLRLYEE